MARGCFGRLEADRVYRLREGNTTPYPLRGLERSLAEESPMPGRGMGASVTRNQGHPRGLMSRHADWHVRSRNPGPFAPGARPVR
jgi:hypothetical protein